MERVDKKITFEKFVSIYYEEHPYLVYQHLAKTESVAKAFGVPLLHGLPKKQKGQKYTR